MGILSSSFIRSLIPGKHRALPASRGTPTFLAQHHRRNTFNLFDSLFRSFDGVKGGRLYGSWNASDLGLAEFQAALPVLRNRSRDLALNNDYIKRYLDLLASNVVGHKGAVLKCGFRDRKGRLLIDLNEHIEEAFFIWSRRGVCEVTGQYSWPALQRQVIQRVARDGEVFIRKLIGTDFN